MLRVPDAMSAPLEKFLISLFTGELRDPEALASALNLLAIASIPGAQAARKLRQQYRKLRAQEALLGDAGWSDRATPGDVVPFARKKDKESPVGG